MIPDQADTIAAIGTAVGGAARGMIRVSGPETVACLARCFRPDDFNDQLGTISHPQLIVGEFQLEEDLSVPCDLFLWPDTQSYTRQPSAELHTVGSPPLLEEMLATLCRHGARIAEPGEFTLRAFLAGRLDLTQAEAVLGVIDAADSQSLHSALGQLAGGLSKPLGELREQLLLLLAHLEAGLDFVEEDISFISATETERQLRAAQELVAATLAQLATRNQPQILPKVVLTGRPNVGKSSLFNALVKKFATSNEQVRALVSSQAGTTRDYLAAAVSFRGQPCELVDTAGFEPQLLRDSIPGIAQKMTTDQRRQADCRVVCLDLTELTTAAEIADFVGQENNSVILAATKLDLKAGKLEMPSDSRIVPCSSYTGSGLATLATAIAGELSSTNVSSSSVASTAARCVDSLQRAAESLQSARELVTVGGGDELVAAEIRVALQELGRVVGVVYTDDVLDRIFSQFCIGK
jgi:tRNA modification GTPase